MRHKSHQRKRRRVRKRTDGHKAGVTSSSPDITLESLFAPIIAVLESDVHVPEDGEISFEQYMVPLLQDYSTAFLQAQERLVYHEAVR